MMIATTNKRLNFIIGLLIINIHNKIQTYLGVCIVLGYFLPKNNLEQRSFILFGECECGSSFNLKEFDTFKCFKISTVIYNPVEDDIVTGHISLCVTILGHRSQVFVKPGSGRRVRGLIHLLSNVCLQLQLGTLDCRSVKMKVYFKE